MSIQKLIEKIENYPFESQGGDLRNCVDWIELKAAFQPIEGLDEAIAEAESYAEFENLTRGDIPNCWKTIIEAARQHASAAIPEGFVLVPREPTEAMIQTGRTVSIGQDGVSNIYKAMIEAAAPAQGEPP